MSTISTRQNVRTVEAAATAEPVHTIGPALATGFTLLLSAAARSLYSAMSARQRLAEKAVGAPSAQPLTLPPAVAIDSGITPLEAEQVSGLLDLHVTPLDSESRGDVEVGARAVLESTTPETARAARQRLGAVLRDSHQKVFNSALLTCCRRAALEMGFQPATMASGIPLRMAAMDAQGRAIVTEIRLEADGTTALESEVAGVTDGSCTQLMERYEALLEQQGVRSKAPGRRPTGGVLETTAARVFMGQRLKAPHVALGTGPGGKQVSRRTPPKVRQS